jgi:hypothetical protein
MYTFLLFSVVLFAYYTLPLQLKIIDFPFYFNGRHHFAMAVIFDAI